MRESLRAQLLKQVALLFRTASIVIIEGSRRVRRLRDDRMSTGLSKDSGIYKHIGTIILRQGVGSEKPKKKRIRGDAKNIIVSRNYLWGKVQPV